MSRCIALFLAGLALIALSSTAGLSQNKKDAGTKSSPPAVKPPVANPPVVTPPVVKPPVLKPPVGNPPVTTPPVLKPPVLKPPVINPPVTTDPLTKKPKNSDKITLPSDVKLPGGTKKPPVVVGSPSPVPPPIKIAKGEIHTLPKKKITPGVAIILLPIPIPIGIGPGIPVVPIGPAVPIVPVPVDPVPVPVEPPVVVAAPPPATPIDPVGVVPAQPAQAQPAKEYGLRIVELDPGPAQKAGLKVGDVILAVGDYRTQTYEDLRQLVQASTGPFEVSYWSATANKLLKVTVTPVEKRIGVGIEPIEIE